MRNKRNLFEPPTLSLDDYIEAALEPCFNPFIDDNKMSPEYNIIENDKSFLIELNFAGIAKKDINLDVDNDILKIIAKRKKNKDSKYEHTGIYFGGYETLFKLPEDVDKQTINAVLEQGILNITINKIEDSVNPKKMKIEIS